MPEQNVRGCPAIQVSRSLYDQPPDILTAVSKKYDLAGFFRRKAVRRVVYGLTAIQVVASMALPATRRWVEFHRRPLPGGHHDLGRGFRRSSTDGHHWPARLHDVGDRAGNAFGRVHAGLIRAVAYRERDSRFFWSPPHVEAHSNAVRPYDHRGLRPSGRADLRRADRP